MRKAIIVSGVGALLFGTLWAVPPALGKGGTTTGTTIWWYVGGDTSVVYKAVFTKDSNGTVHEQRSAPQKESITFTPAWKFRPPKSGSYITFWYRPNSYTIISSNPPGKTLDDFFVSAYKYPDGSIYSEYWAQITVQN